MENYSLKWEFLVKDGLDGPDQTMRSKVPGGWLIYARYSRSCSVTFMPDPAHEWSVKIDDRKSNLKYKKTYPESNGDEWVSCK